MSKLVMPVWDDCGLNQKHMVKLVGIVMAGMVMYCMREFPSVSPPGWERLAA